MTYDETKRSYEELVSSGKLAEAIDKALSAPFQQIAVHYLIDRLMELYTLSPPRNPSPVETLNQQREHEYG